MPGLPASAPAGHPATQADAVLQKTGHPVRVRALRRLLAARCQQRDQQGRLLPRLAAEGTGRPEVETVLQECGQRGLACSY